MYYIKKLYARIWGYFYIKKNAKRVARLIAGIERDEKGRWVIPAEPKSKDN